LTRHGVHAPTRAATAPLGITADLQFSPWISWVNNVQYDAQRSLIGWQSRFRWILRPANDLSVVYTHNWLDERLYTFRF
jgi:hypothetical protein